MNAIVPYGDPSWLADYDTGLFGRRGGRRRRKLFGGKLGRKLKRAVKKLSRVPGKVIRTARKIARSPLARAIANTPFAKQAARALTSALPGGIGKAANRAMQAWNSPQARQIRNALRSPGARAAERQVSRLLQKRGARSPVNAISQLRRRFFDTRGLTPDGTGYVIEKDDTPAGVAEKLTGDRTRYTELFASNPEKSTVKTSYGRNFKYFPVGQTIKLPESWQTPLPTPDETAPEVTTPTSVDEVLTTTSQLPIPLPGGGAVSIPPDFTPPEPEAETEAETEPETVPASVPTVSTPSWMPETPVLELPPMVVSAPAPETAPELPELPEAPEVPEVVPASLPLPTTETEETAPAATAAAEPADDDGVGTLFGLGLLGTAAAFASGLVKV